MASGPCRAASSRRSSPGVRPRESRVAHDLPQPRKHADGVRRSYTHLTLSSSSMPFPCPESASVTPTHGVSASTSSHSPDCTGAQLPLRPNRSFANGRLFNQVESMTEHYKYPMLLIEFDQNKSFTLEPFTDFSAPAASNSAPTSSDLQAKLVMLTLAFPHLRIIWSSSPYQTAEIFAELKKQESGTSCPLLDPFLLTGSYR